MHARHTLHRPAAGLLNDHEQPGRLDLAPFRPAVTMPERSPGTVTVMAADVLTRGRRLLTARTAIPLGVMAFALNVTAIVLTAVAGQSAPQIVRISALLPTVAVGMLVAVRRPDNAL